MKSLFITFEGGEGCGKSTASHLLQKKLEQNGYDVIWTREPGGTPIAEKIREIILDKENINLVPEAEALLFAAARAQHYKEKIEPALKENKIVLCDRWLDSSLAYQGYARNLGVEEVTMINDFGIKGVRPNIEFFLDVTPTIGFERIKSRKQTDRMEDEDMQFHQTIYEFFKCNALHNPYIVTIPGDLSIDEIVEKMYSTIIMVMDAAKTFENN